MDLNNKKVNVIAKSGIRYTGILTESNDSRTIQLLNVIVHGTENRECRMKVNPSDAIYEYICINRDNVEKITPFCTKARKRRSNSMEKNINAEVPSSDFDFKKCDTIEGLDNHKVLYDHKKDFYDGL